MFMPKFSLKADRLTLFNEVLIANSTTGELKNINKIRANSATDKEGNKILVKKQYHNFKISNSAQKTIQDKINWLFVLSRARYQKTYSGKEIHNFKVNFLTLTLPSKQLHATSQITKECFNQFLTEIRERTKMENYVWRLEFQKNGNLHYHIVTDTYIDYNLARKIWNRIINKLGYVSAYQHKFSAMTLSEYVLNSATHDNNTFDVLAKRYAKGKKENWTNPPSVDSKVATSNKAIAFYISKYFGKQDKTAKICNELDNEENSFSLRLWFCSRSLSKLKSICDYVEIQKIDWFSLLHGMDKVREVFCDYARCLFFDIKNLTNYAKSLLYQAYREYANDVGYCSA